MIMLFLIVFRKPNVDFDVNDDYDDDWKKFLFFVGR